MLLDIFSRKETPKRVLAVCSGGGHWVQLKRLSPAFEGAEVTLATVLPTDLRGFPEGRVIGIPDANRDTKIKMIWLLLRLVWVLLKVRPHCVISTGAAPGYLAIRIGKLLGAKTLFLDSIANAEELSMSARLASRHADITLSQWEHVAANYGVEYWGAVI